ncbi:hypothetical protein [Crocinitomix catalasitica]|uniref:hypothetical protein n=1 Tax=Crocinitomix catalasitica TaxID=184607 RepID=UPI0004893199|nr:hypothetical protein [Crocinitomix catalasitica]
MASSFAEAKQGEVMSKYKTQTNPYFMFTKFKRGFDNDSLRSTLDELEKIPRKKWTRIDSLQFASTSLKTGNLKLADYYFEHITLTASDEEFWWDHMVLHLLNKDFKGGLKEIKSKYPGILEFSEVYFLEKIFQAYLRMKTNEQWHKTDVVLDWEVDSNILYIDKNNIEFERNIITPLNHLNNVLHRLIHHIHSEDPILARVCFEMGTILEKHISVTQAYIAYNLGRNYNKWDKEILNAVKAAKFQMSEQQLKIPVFRRYFPRIEHWRFEYAVLKEKIKNAQNDTIHYKSPVLMKKTKENKLPIPAELVIVIGLALIFLLILIFVRTKK